MKPLLYAFTLTALGGCFYTETPYGRTAVLDLPVLVLNNNRFKIDNAEIRFPEQSTGSTLQIDPFIVFNASTKVGKERIEVF